MCFSYCSSHILYACVWYKPDRFRTIAGANPVATFSALVAAAKVVQQLTLLAWVNSTGTDIMSTILLAGYSRWLLAAVFMALGQSLNGAFYSAIGMDGVYYGFKLGRPVPWSTAGVFSLGFRHPQYVGGLYSQLGVICLIASPQAFSAGLLPLIAAWCVLYCLTSYMEATGDNDDDKSG